MSPRKSGMLLERFELGAEEKRFAGPAVVERLFAGAIARQVQRLLFAIPQAEREHAVEFFQRSLDAPARNRREHDFGVGVAAELFAELLQFLAQTTLKL